MPTEDRFKTIAEVLNENEDVQAMVKRANIADFRRYRNLVTAFSDAAAMQGWRAEEANGIITLRSTTPGTQPITFTIPLMEIEVVQA